MTSPAPAPARSTWRGRANLLIAALAAAALLFFLGWMMGRSPVAGLERERDEAGTRAALLGANTALYRAAVALEERNFGTANDHLRRANAALTPLASSDDVPGLGSEASSAVREVRTALAATNLNVAVDVERQRATVLELAARLGRVADAAAPAPADSAVAAQ